MNSKIKAGWSKVLFVRLCSCLAILTCSETSKNTIHINKSAMQKVSHVNEPTKPHQLWHEIVSKTFFFYLGFISPTFTIHCTEGETRGFLTSLYNFNPLHRHLDISRAITAEGLSLHIASSRNRTRNLWFEGASR